MTDSESTRTNGCQWNRTHIRNGCEVRASIERVTPNRRKLARRIQRYTDEICAILKRRRCNRRSAIWQSEKLDRRPHNSIECSGYRRNRASIMKDDGVEGWTADGGCIQIRNAGYIQKQRCEPRKSIEHVGRIQCRNGRRYREGR